MTHHQPVLLEEIAERAAAATRVVDATLGDGGHAGMFRRQGAEVLGIDRDPEAIRRARARLGDERIHYLQAAYSDPAALAAVEDFHPDFILLDLGVSSGQLDQDQRGFSFRPGVPLDMRMERTGRTAADFLNAADEAELQRTFAEYGDEPRARALAREIVRRRERAAFALSDDLVNAIRAVLGPRSGPADFARLFQAVRIAVNDELEGLSRALPAFLSALPPVGTIAVISYHSGEDRVVKHAFQEWARACVCPPRQPVCTCRGHPLGSLDPRRPIRPGPAETEANPRARSAKLRLFRKHP
ncbi:MAG: 16S rRNA (cytosine(1402)-N(4))-methyltransferase RsmH [Gemmatimonadales bacterium]